MIAIIAVLIVVFTRTQNKLLELKEDVFLQQAQVETNLQRRSDLIPNLVETVSSYATFEETVFAEIADARESLSESIESGDIESMNEANTALDSALNKLLAISENYPELQASEQFIALMDELAGTENR